MATNNRDLAIDVAKGIGIVLVFLGHSIEGGSPLGKIIYGFHMPLFFILSGFFVAKNLDCGMMRFFKRSITGFATPYVLFALIAFVVHWVFWEKGLPGLSAIIFWLGHFAMGGAQYNGPAWFLKSLFFGEVLFLYLLMGLNHVKMQWMKRLYVGSVAGLLVAITYLLYTLPDGIKYKLPMTLCNWALAAFFLGCGHYGYRLIVFLKRNTQLAVLVCIIVLGLEALIAVNVPRSSVSGYVWGSSWFILTAVFGSLFVVSFSLIICKTLPKFVFIPIVFVGSNSLCFFLSDMIARPFIRAFIVCGGWQEAFLTLLAVAAIIPVLKLLLVSAQDGVRKFI